MRKGEMWKIGKRMGGRDEGTGPNRHTLPGGREGEEAVGTHQMQGCVGVLGGQRCTHTPTDGEKRQQVG